MIELAVKIDGVKFSGWKSVRLVRSIENLAWLFSISTSRWPGSESRPKQHTPVQILAGGAVVIDGYIDRAPFDYDASQSELAIEGRSATADLIDCDLIHPSGQWKSRSMLDIAREVAEPFGLDVRDQLGPGTSVHDKFKSFSAEEGESVFALLERMARQRGVLLTTDGKKTLNLTKLGQGVHATPLKLPGNIARGHVEDDGTDRYSHYYARGQNAVGSGENATAPRALARDPDVRRYRPFVISAEDAANQDTLERRARWERNMRLARSERFVYDVPGWTDPAGARPLWTPNFYVNVDDPMGGISKRMLITEVTHTLDSRGLVSTISVVEPQALFQDIQGGAAA